MSYRIVNGSGKILQRRTGKKVLGAEVEVQVETVGYGSVGGRGIDS